jgi:hypothetical protein
MPGEQEPDRKVAEACATLLVPTSWGASPGQNRGGVAMPSEGEQCDPVCLVCSRFIPEGAALMFMRRDNLIHVGCLAAAQRRAEAPPAKTPTSTSS